jgi:hypothetical protein
MLYDDEPTVWRKRAEEVRVQAENMTNLKSRRSMLGIAKSYDRMAEHAEDRIRQDARRAERAR